MIFELSLNRFIIVKRQAVLSRQRQHEERVCGPGGPCMSRKKDKLKG